MIHGIASQCVLPLAMTWCFGGNPMKRTLALMMTALLCLSLLAGCGTEGGEYTPTGDGLTWDDPSQATTPTDPVLEDNDLITVYTPDSTYNPYFSNNLNNRAWMSLIYQGLFVADSSYEAHPILCENYWMSDDMQTYVFYIRSDAVFSDGTPLTLADVEASLTFAMESDRYRGRFHHVDTMFAADGAITFRLDTPYEDFPLLLDVPILKQTELTAVQPLGTGPYRLTSGAGGMRLVKVASWWANAELPITGSAVTLREAKSPLQVRDDFERSDMELVCTDPGNPDYAAYRCDYELWDCETGTFLYLSVNRNSWIFANEALLRSLTNVIDREQIVADFYHGYARPSTLAASPLSPYYDSILASQYGQYDPLLFAQAFQATDLGDGAVRLLVNSASAQRLSIAHRIESMLEAQGMTVEVVAYTGNDYTYTLAIGNYDLHLAQTTLSPNMDLTSFFSSNGVLSYGLSSTRLYALCLDSLANRGNYYNLLKEVAEDGHLIPILFCTNAVYGKRGAASALSPSRDHVFYYDLGATAEDVLLDERRTDTLG